MKGSTKAGINPIKLGGVKKGTSVAGLTTKGVGAMKPVVSKNQNLNIKKRKGNYEGVYQDMASKIHSRRGGSVMKKLLGV